MDLLADFEGRVISAVPRLRQLVVAGESYVSRTVNEPVLMTASAGLAMELHLVGHNTIQCFWDGKQVKFIEVNPRFGGAAALGSPQGSTHQPCCFACWRESQSRRGLASSSPI